jgi:signal transduction histidine kinase
VRDVCRDAAQDVHAEARRRGLSLSMTLPPEPVSVSADAEAMRRVILILLDNALKYTPAGGAIQIVVSTSGSGNETRVVIDITDDGIGIAPEEQPRVLDRFYRGAGARARVPDGSGLGLAIAHTIVERAGGAIAVRTGPDGRGCQARVEWPRP